MFQESRCWFVWGIGTCELYKAAQKDKIFKDSLPKAQEWSILIYRKQAGMARGQVGSIWNYE